MNGNKQSDSRTNILNEDLSKTKMGYTFQDLWEISVQ